MRVVELLAQVVDLGLGLVRALDRIAAARRIGLELALVGGELGDGRLELREAIACLAVLRRQFGDAAFERLDLRRSARNRGESGGPGRAGTTPGAARR